MGLLAESKRSSKISRDPNNTKWTKNANSFGQKIMRSQGWEPGQYLGAQDAAHAESYTAANASYIRVTLKDDMKGLGFNKAKEDQVTGLDVFSDLLSRLNGKSEEEVEDGRQARMAVKANLYVEQKWGPMRFVRGGLLVGDKLDSLENEASSKDSSSSDEASEEEKPKKSKKRKVSEGEEEDGQAEAEAARKKRRKEERKLKKSRDQDPAEDETKSGKKSKKSKKDKPDDGSDAGPPAEETKAERKERKREKKEKKRKRKEALESDGDATPSATASALPSGTSTPTGTGTSTPIRGSRNFVRSRFIAQKKEALLDAKALAQIFMVKA